MTVEMVRHIVIKLEFSNQCREGRHTVVLVCRTVHCTVTAGWVPGRDVYTVQYKPAGY